MLAVLDILISLAFIYGLFSVLVSAATELLLTMWSQRAKTLWRALQGLLPLDGGSISGGAAESFLRHPLVQGMGAAEHDRSQGGFWWRKVLILLRTTHIGDGRRASFPSYLSPMVFVDTILHMLRSGEIRKGTVDRGAGLEALIADVSNPQLRMTLETLHESALDSGIAFRHRLQLWFDEAMDRASGWYRRLSHLVLFLVALIMAVWCNLDTIHIVSTLASNGEIRKLMAEKATEFAKNQVDRIMVTPPPSAVPFSPGPITAVGVTGEDPVIAAKMQQYSAAMEQLNSLGIPWRWGTQERIYVLTHPFLSIVGWFMTALAATMGANFWFQVLGGLVRMRLSGNKPEGAPPVGAQPAQPVVVAHPGQSVNGLLEPLPPPPGYGLESHLLDDGESGVDARRSEVMV
jgi:hypothetical protein